MAYIKYGIYNMAYININQYWLLSCEAIDYHDKL